MNEAQLYSLAQLQSQQHTTFAYQLQNDPKPGSKVMHTFAIDHVIYGIAAAVMPHMEAGITIKDIAKLVMVEYYHFPSRQFEIHAPSLLFEAAKQVTNTPTSQLCNQQLRNQSVN